MVIRRLTPLPLQQVKIQGGFWGPRLEMVRIKTVPHLYHFLQSAGYLDAWNLDWKEGQSKKPHIFWDSDTAKTFEAIAYALVFHPDETLEGIRLPQKATLSSEYAPGLLGGVVVITGQGIRLE